MTNLKKRGRALCQCPNDPDSDEPCKMVALNNSLFCETHQNCKPAPVNGSEPKYIPNILNKSYAYKETNNCISYALRGNNINKELVAQCKSETDCNVNFEQPGAASGQRGAMRKETLRTCPVVKSLVKSLVKSPVKYPVKSHVKSTAKSLVKSQVKSPAKFAV